MALSAAEQYELELINRARLDPAAEAARYGISLNQNLPEGTISTEAKQVLAPDTDLEEAAQGHSEWMLSTDTFSHTGSGGSSAGNRMTAAGYSFAGTWGWAENLASVMTTGPIDLAAAIEQHHALLFQSEIHRENTMNGDMREIGIAQVEGQFTYQGTTYTTSMLTENFAYSGTEVFVTGVAYDDADNDAFYGIGEGLAGIRFTAAGIGATSASAGGYSVGVAPTGAVSVSVMQGSATLAVLTMDVSGGNGKLDLVLGANDVWRLELSASATLVSGVADATLLGVADLDLTGHGGANVLIGNKGVNTLSGLDGSDVLYGAEGLDALYGGSGADWVDGGTGADILNGGLGNDAYVVETAGDWVQEDTTILQGGGLDTVYSAISLELTPNAEVLVLQGSEDLTGTGRAMGRDGLIGNNGDNRLDGQGGDDVLSGGAGNDTLTGGAGQDVLIGAAGADVFVYRATTDSAVGASATDTIGDFQRGLDRIDLHLVDANALVAGNQAFDFIGAAGFSGWGAASAGELRAITWGGGNFTLVQMDSDGDGAIDMQIFVQGTSLLTASDFIL